MANDMGDGTLGSRWWRVLNVALLAGSAAATLVALSVVAALIWWLIAPAQANPERASAPKRAAAPPQAAVPAQPPPPVAAQPPAAQQPVAPLPEGAAPPAPASWKPPAKSAAAAPPAAVPPARTGPGYKHARDRDAEMSRGIAQGLQNLAKDPEAMRKLGVPDHQGPAE